MPLPSRLYKYESFTAQALENLKNHSVYFASPSCFNDPYDCAVSPGVKEPSDRDVERIRNYYLAKADVPENARSQFERLDVASMRAMLLRQGQSVLDEAVKEFLSTRGVTCFSERNDSLLMWGHYGGRFKGFCLEFRTDCPPLTKARQVRYAEEMPQVDLIPLLCSDEEDSREVLDLYCTKALDWHYEKEWRCMHDKAGTLYTYPAEALTGIFIGPDAAFASFEILALIIMNQNPGVQLWQGRRSQSEFSVEFEPVTYTPHLEAKRLGLLPRDA
ncbi:DUF2971 domain-containing protein [Zoogloea sp.]|uniref:DUF2971 domain-containing protein n=1 Tax=Zoogloea sp. TaxID=49181 RepID=UPI0035B3DA5A